MAELTPKQVETLDVLRNSECAEIADDVVIELRGDLDRGLTELTERIERSSGGHGGAELRATKHDVERVLTCEALWASADDFRWTPERARGTVAHRAIQLAVHWPGSPPPTTLVDEAIERLQDADKSLSDWLRTIDPGDHADLRGQAVERVTKFLECFPGLKGSWYPVTESTLRYPQAGTIVMIGKVDLTLGGRQTRKVIVDFKTGRLNDRNREDLRFYALIETARMYVPPRLLASYSLDSASAATEVVTEGVLRTALRRALDAIERMVEVRCEGREPERTPSPACRWCPLLDTCEPGRAWVEESSTGLD